MREKLRYKDKLTSEMGENPNASIMNNLSSLKSKKMQNTLNQPVSIINKTVNDFRSNLKKYYLNYGDNQLYVKPKNGQSFGINFSELSSLTDLYNMMKGFGSPTIVPKVILKKDFEEFMIETNQIFSFNGYFDNDENFEIIESTKEYLEKCNPNWIGIDNQIYREFFYLTLGEYSGYSK